MHAQQLLRLLLLLVLTVTTLPAVSKKYTVKDFVRYPEFHQAKISPTGEFIAITQQENRRVRLVIMRLPEMMTVGMIQGHWNEQVWGFHWANDERLVLQMYEVKNSDTSPRSHGQIYAANYDGSNARVIFGWKSGMESIGTRKQPGIIAAGRIIDLLPDDPDHILVSSHRLSRGKIRLVAPDVHMVNINTGRRREGLSAPMNNGFFTTDHEGEVRLFSGVGGGFDNITYIRRDADWQKLPENLQDMYAMDFDATGRYLQALVRNKDHDRYSLYRIDTQNLAAEPLIQPDLVDLRPGDGIYDTNQHLVGMIERPDTFRYHYIEPDNQVAKWHKALTRAFENQIVRFTSFTRDGSRAILLVGGDTNPGDFFLFNTETKQAGYLFSRMEWLDPNEMARVTPISYTASDGLEIHGYLTRTAGLEQPAPLIVIPHGGPALRDVWGFDREAQLLAHRGYAVLQVNFRSSDGYGLDFRNAGNRKWGSRVQEDIADGVRWAISEGIADPDRIGIYGASFGGYSALMSVILHPDLYSASVGLAGLYDIETQLKRSDTAEFDMSDDFFERVFGSDEELHQRFSPIYLTDRIKVPVFIAHGKQDERTPIAHARKLRDAMEKNNIPFEWMVKPNEGHGYFLEKNRVAFYKALVKFFDKHLKE